MARGKLITFEGGEGSGKSTQAKKLFEHLVRNDIPAIHTREPGGTEEAEKIRSILVTGSQNKISPLTEVFLHSAARIEHLNKVILPAIAEGKIVVCDRFFDSTVAYQGYGHGVSLKTIEAINKIVAGDFQPDLTFIFDIDAKSGLARSTKRHGIEKSDENRYENIELAFHKRLRNGFLAIAGKENRCVVLNAEEDIETLHKEVVELVEKKLMADGQ